MIWATVSSWSYFCWLYRASPSLAAKNIISLISVLTIWWCPCVESSLVLLEEGVCCDSLNVDIHSCHLLFDHFQFALIHGPNIPGSYAVLLFIASDLASVTSPIHNWVLFLLWLHPFVLSGVLSPLISSSILGTYRPGEFLFQCPIILPSHTVHGVLKARILKWFAIPFSSGPQSVRPPHHDPTVLGGPTRQGLVSLS